MNLFWVLSLLVSLSSTAQLNLMAVSPKHSTTEMFVQWSTVASAQEYQYRKKVDAGPYSAWTTNGTNVSFTDPGLSAASSYTYQVRVRVAGVWTDTSKERSNNFTVQWPVRKTDCSDNIVELMHGFGQPIKAGGAKYFHEGVDINADKTVANECVRAPIGGIIYQRGGSGSNIYVDIKININGSDEYISFNHLDNLHAGLQLNESVAPGDTLGYIKSGIWSTLTAHTHFNYNTVAGGYTSSNKNPFTFWTVNAYKDPQEKDPELMDTNGDGEFIRFRKTPNSTDYFADNKVHNGVDIVAEAVDKQTTSAPWQTPGIVGYYIQKEQNGAWVNAVKSSASPYIMYDSRVYYQSNSGASNTPVVETIIDYRDALKATKPAGYDFEHWFTFIVTNTKGSDGTIANLDSNQHWATDARTTVTEDNGYKTNYDKARVIDEAKFPDGKYKLFIRLRDLVKSPADKDKELTVDNFRPYAKKVEIKSGKLDYSAIWNWNAGSAKLSLQETNNNEKGCGIVKIKVAFSEPMKNASVEVASLTYIKLNTTPTDNDRKVFEFEIPAEKTKNATEGPHKILINGKDMNDNDLQGFLSKSDVPAAGIEKKKLDGTFDPGNPPTKDKVHEFKLFSLKNITVTTTDASACNKSDGKATINVPDSVLALVEYAVDGSAFQASKEFEKLAPGNHTAKVRLKTTDCEFTKEFEIKEGNKLSVTISGTGTTQFCDNQNPPTVTLTASASGGSGKFEYSWPGATLQVNSSGTFSVTVTDTVTKCKETAKGDVIFVPIICSRDPNDIIGPEGYGPGKMISKFRQHAYMIRFENDPDFATAPAQIVRINHPLDTNVNLFSLRLGDFGFGKFTFTIPPNRTYYSTRLNVMDSLGVVVDLTAGIDVTKKEAFWIFESKNPATGLPPTEAHLGFLPVNDSSAKGEGFVTYTIKPANHTQTGDSVRAEATIVFDLNAAIVTPKIFNTIDALPPVSSLAALPSTTDSVSFVIRWSGRDEPNGSGVRDYALYVSENRGPFVVYQSGIVDTFTRFAGRGGYTYSFFTLATDNTGNVEAMKTTGQDTITISGNSVFLTMKAFLHGPYNASLGQMNDSLRAKSLLPTQEPYQAIPNFTSANNPTRETVHPGVFDSTGNRAVVDWVWLELRNSSNPAQVVATRSALLRKDGNVVDRDGVSPVYFNYTPEGSYYVALRHRNHFAVMTAAPITFHNTAGVSIDFTSPATATYGENAQKNINGVMAMWAGDINGDGLIKYNGAANDKVLILAKVGVANPNNIVLGYERTDLNLDGIVRYNGATNDKTIILSNVGVATPNNVLNERLPR